MPSLIQPLLRTMTPARHPPHLTPALFKSHSQQLPSSRCIESAHALQCDLRFLAGGASDTALGLLDNCRSRLPVWVAVQPPIGRTPDRMPRLLLVWPLSRTKVEARIIQRRWPGLANGGRAE